MSTKEQNNVPGEIDLSVLFQKMNDFLGEISFSIFKGILLIQKNLILLIVLILLGFGVGSFLDVENSSFKNEIIVKPNFESTDYLYSKIDLISSKLGERDYKFFKSIGVKSPEKITKIEVQPIVDIYNFVNNSQTVTNTTNTQNFELIRLLAESGDINKIVKDKLTSRNYPLHTITINTKGSIKEENIITPILNYLNASEYYGNIQKTETNNSLIKINKDQEVIAQIDILLNEFSSSIGDKSKGGNNSVYNNGNTQLNEIISNKNNLISEIAQLKIYMLSSDKTIKDVSKAINIKETKSINGKVKLILPIFFIFIFISVRLFEAFYKKQKAKLNS